MNSTIPAHRYGLTDDEWEVLRRVAWRSDGPSDLAARLGEQADILTLEGSPEGRVTGGRFDLLMHWIADDDAFSTLLYEELLAPL